MADHQIASLLTACMDSERISAGGSDRAAYSGDMWPRIQLWKQMGNFDRSLPDCVVWPESVEEVQKVLVLCAEQGVPIVPYGAGSGVCGGTVPIRGGVVVDVRRLDRIIEIDDDALTIDVEAGIVGHHLEKALQERGFTLGHFPSSILCSTLGGWLATRSAGQFSSRYGKIEDMVLGLEVVLASGEVLRTGLLGRDDDLDWTQVFVGSEGTLGVLTRALLRIEKAPEAREYRGYRFPSLQNAVEGMRTVMQSGLRPTVLRLYDPLDTLVGGKDGKETGEGGLLERLSALVRHATELEEGLSEEEDAGPMGWLRSHFRERFSPLMSNMRSKAVQVVLTNPRLMNQVMNLVTSECLLIFGTEGSEEEVAAEMAEICSILDALGGKDEGTGPGEYWLEHRYDVSFKQSKIFAEGAFADTIEVACPWSRLLEMYDEVRRTLAQHVVVMGHFSHAYREGCSIYFTFAGSGEVPGDAEQIYTRVWNEALNAVVRSGGTISHHHGIGLLKRDFMMREHAQGDRVFSALKAHFDPTGMMNPGKLFPDATGEETGGQEVASS